MKRDQGFAIWMTGLPASGKSTIVRMLLELLHDIGILPAVLESDTVRRILTPEPVYSDAERDLFYEQLVRFGAMLTHNHIPVIFDATANRRSYRDRARTLIPKYLEVFVDTPLEVCKERDPKGLYRAAGRRGYSEVPGVHAVYERPILPDLILDGQADPALNAVRVAEKARKAGFI